MNFEFADEQELDGLMSDEENEEAEVSARPRRMSEVNAATTIQPIPPATSFFVFSQSNRFHYFSSLFFLIQFEFVKVFFSSNSFA